MTATTDPRTDSGDISARLIIPFVLLTFGVSWTAIWVLLSPPSGLPAILAVEGVLNPLYIVAVWAPAIVAIALILWQTGRAGLARFFGRLWRVHVPWQWWAFALLALPAIKIAGALLNGAGLRDLLVLQPFSQVLGISVFMLFLGPVEEFGWRGFLLPLMQRVMIPASAGVIVGLLWAVWHIPAFFLDGAPHTAWSMTPFIVGVTSVGVIMAVVYNKTGGNLLLPVLIHWQLNIAFWPEAQPWENYLNLLLALLLLWWHRDVMFDRESGLRSVIP